MTLPELKAIVSQYLLLEDTKILKFLAAVTIANRMPMLTPTWVFLIGASSGGKSTLLEPFNKLNGFFIDDLTANTLFSSMKSSNGNENSLIFAIPHGGMVLITDFTLMLDKDEKVVQQIMSQFRLIYDGKFKKYAGNGESPEWSGRFGLVAGVTTAVYQKQSQYAALGERMVYYCFDQPDRHAATMMAINNLNKTQEAKDRIGTAFAEYVSSVKIPDVLFDIGLEVKTNLINLSEMATRARSSVARERYNKDHTIQQINALEMPMRMAKQLLNIAQGLVALNRGFKLDDEDLAILYKTALDSIPLTRKQVMEKMTTFSRANVEGIAADLGLPFDTVKQHVEDLAALGVITQHVGVGTRKFYYELKPEYRALISQFKDIQMTESALELSNSDQDYN